jgi:hypothetical protein
MTIALGIVVLVIICIVLASRSVPNRRSRGTGSRALRWFYADGSSDGGSGFDGGGGGGGDC